MISSRKYESLHSLQGRSDVQRSLENASFENEKLGALYIGPGNPPSSVVSVKNCIFSKCEVGTSSIDEGVILDQVIFEDVLSPDSMLIRLPTVLKNVVVRSTARVPGLWVKPVLTVDLGGPEQKRLYESWAAEASLGVECMLDFSGLNADEVEVVGLPIAKLKWNPERDRDVPVVSAWQASKVWKNISSNGFWSSRVLYLKRRGATEGIYTFPSPNSKLYARAIAERDLLIDAGLLPVV